VTIAPQTRNAIRFRGRSFLALVLVPEPPLADWMVELDEWNTRSPGFFRGKAVVLDVSGIEHDKDGLAKLIAALGERDIRLMGVEGTKGTWLGPGLPPLINGGRQADVSEIAAAIPQQRTEAPDNSGAIAGKPDRLGLKAPEGNRSLVLDSPVRSGQSVIHPDGDVTILGHVASGAEVIAGGSIHVYGALRGRAIAGSTGNPQARIFCNKLEAELVAIDGLYRTADEMDPQFRGKPVQAWLTGDSMTMAALT
jgi:septum site-determining protein MinC